MKIVTKNKIVVVSRRAGATCPEDWNFSPTAQRAERQFNAARLKIKSRM